MLPLGRGGGQVIKSEHLVKGNAMSGPMHGSTVAAAAYAIRVHCSISWPEGSRCLNCHQLFPCETHRLAYETLVDDGWTDLQIEALDQRTGPWS